MRRSVGIGDRHHDEEVGDRAVRGEPLVPVEDVAVAVPNGARPELGRIRAGRVGLGHRERRANLTLRAAGRASAPSARRCRRARGSRCSRVGRLAAEDRWRVDRRAEDLVHQPELDLSEPLATELRREVRRPQAPLLDPLLERRADPVELGLTDLVLDRLDRPDLLANECRASTRAAPRTPRQWRSPTPRSTSFLD